MQTATELTSKERDAMLGMNYIVISAPLRPNWIHKYLFRHKGRKLKGRPNYPPVKPQWIVDWIDRTPYQIGDDLLKSIEEFVEVVHWGKFEVLSPNSHLTPFANERLKNKMIESLTAELKDNEA